MKKDLGKFFSKKEFKYILFFLVLLIIDLISKYVVKLYNVSTNTNFIDITYRTNIGSLFSLFSQAKYVNFIFIILSLIAIYIIYLIWKNEKKYFFQLGLIVTGILGNLINRVTYGYVIDWINLNFWPVFNIADSCIVIGVIWLSIILIKEKND